MCWSAAASLSAFLSGLLVSVGVSIFAYRQKKWSLMALAVGWTWVIGMQLWEYFIWRNPTSNETYASLAYVFNITQILVLGLIFLTFFHNQGMVCRGVAMGVLLLYTCYMLYFSPQMGSMNVRPVSCTDGLPHLQYPWWTMMPLGGLIYILSLILIFLLLVRPLAWSVKTIAMIMTLFFFSWTFYSKSVASMWCFFAVSMPILSMLAS